MAPETGSYSVRVMDPENKFYRVIVMCADDIFHSNKVMGPETRLYSVRVMGPEFFFNSVIVICPDDNFSQH